MKVTNLPLLLCGALVAEIWCGNIFGNTYFHEDDFILNLIAFISGMLNGIFFHFEFSKIFSPIPIGKLSYLFPMIFCFGFGAAYFKNENLFFVIVPALFAVCIGSSIYYNKKLKTIKKQKEKERKKQNEDLRI